MAFDLETGVKSALLADCSVKFERLEVAKLSRYNFFSDMIASNALSETQFTSLSCCDYAIAFFGCCKYLAWDAVLELFVIYTLYYFVCLLPVFF